MVTAAPAGAAGVAAEGAAGVAAAEAAAEAAGGAAAEAAAEAADSSSGGDASSASYPAPHPAFPQLVDQGGPVLTTPKIVTVTFPGDTSATQLQAFGAQVANNSWWDTVRAGYCETGSTTACVGDGPAGTNVAVATAPAASYTDSAQGGASTLQTYIQSLIGTGTGKIPQPTGETILVFYFPATTTITLDGAASCSVFGGYHNSTTAGGVTFTYAIVDECAPQQGSNLTQLQSNTFAASHEIVEASTDPYQTQTTLGFYLNFNDPAILPWNDLGGGEAADMCVDFLGLGQDEATEDAFTVQRIWSNSAAAAGGDPCVPASTSATPYFNAAPETWLLTIPVGGSTTFTADAFSSAAMSSWVLAGYDLNATQTVANPYLTITIGGAKTANVNNGDKVTVSVTLNQDPGTSAGYSQQGGAPGLVLSLNNATNPTAGHYWPFLVVSPADAIDSGLNTVDASEDMPLRPMVKITHQQLEHLREVMRHGL